MRNWNRDFRLLACGVFGVGAFFGILHPLFNNFIVDQIGIQPRELGYIESLREVPGFLNALFTAIIIYFAPPIVACFSLIVMGVGMAAYSQVNSFLRNPPIFIRMEHRISCVVTAAVGHDTRLFSRRREGEVVWAVAKRGKFCHLGDDWIVFDRNRSV